MNEAEVARRLKHLLSVGTVTEVKEGEAICRVTVRGRVSDWLPVLFTASKLLKVWTPITLGEQVFILAPGGESEHGLVLRGLYWDAHPVPSGAEKSSVIEMNDGSRFSYNHETKESKALCKGAVVVDAIGAVAVTSQAAVSVQCQGDASVDTQSNASVKAAGEIDLEAPDIKLKGRVEVEGPLGISGGMTCRGGSSVKLEGALICHGGLSSDSGANLSGAVTINGVAQVGE